MSDIFLSYAREDKERAAQLAAALEGRGWTVFWDPKIPAGKTWRQVIAAELEAARCVLVAWSRVSIGRRWVLEEADHGLERDALVPLLLDAVKPPLGFRSIQAADFQGWQGDQGAAAFRQLVEAVAEKIGLPAKPVPPDPKTPVDFGEWAKLMPNANAGWTPPSTSIPGVDPAQMAELLRRYAEEVKTTPGQSISAGPGPMTTGGPPLGSAPPITPPAPTPPPVLRHHLRDGGEGPEMVLIPAGEFRMGDLDGSGDVNERPTHLVRFARPFHMGRYAVTFNEYDRYARAVGIQLPDDKGWGRGRRPVINVSWEDAVAYCRWLSEQTGQNYRLPSEAEWECAARAGTGSAYWWGGEIGQNRANCDGSVSQWSGRQTAPVGSFQPNPRGLHDTAGNVWEWVQDCWHDDYQGAPEDGTAWEKGGRPWRVLRGGSWGDDPRRARSAFRCYLDPAFRCNDVGFRLACSPPISGL